MRLLKQDYISILDYYNINYSKNLPINLLRKMVEDKLAKKIISILKLKNFPTIYKKKVFNFINSNFNWNIIGNLFIKTFKK